MYLDFSLKLVYKKYIFIFISFLLIFILNSCEFSPTGVNYVDKKQTTPVAHISLNNSSDTLKVFGSTYFDYNIDIGSRNAQSVNLYVDGKVISSNTSLKGSIFFNSTFYSDSNHVLKIEVIANSGTGSLADVFGAEKVLFSKKWTLVINNKITTLVNIVSVYPFDGRLKIVWNKYNNFNFQSYYLNINNTLVAKINNQNTTSWIDSEYVCGDISFRIYIQAANNSGMGDIYNYSGNYPKILSLTVTDSNKVKIVWSKNIFYNNFVSYTIYRGTGDVYYGTPIYNLYNINDTTFTDEDPYFGSVISYRIDVNPHNEFGYPDSSDIKSCIIGKKMPAADYFYYIPSLNSIYITNQYGIYRMDASNYSINDSLPSQNLIANPSAWNLLSISSNGHFAYLTSGPNILKINPLTLAIEQTIPTKTIVGYDSYAGLSFQVNDSNYIAYTSCVPLSYFSNGIQLVDNIILNMNNSTVVDSIPHSEAGFNCRISENNKYFYLDGSLYSLNNNKLYKIGSQQGEFMFLGNGDEYIISASNSIQVRRSSDMSLVNSFYTAGSNNFSLDPATGFIGAAANINGESFYVIYDLNTGDEISKIHVGGFNNYYLANSTLFCSNGYFLPLKLK